MSTYNPDKLNDYLGDYYQNLYPAKLICQWLSYGKKPDDYLGKREIAFIFENDRHHRYQVYKTSAELQKQLAQKRPHKIDIGAVYNVPPTLHKSTPDFKAQERELVFDIDLTDYDDIRRCCSSATVCQKCWKFIVMAARVLDVILRNHFGFHQMLWIFSGRRGMHCWVADQGARSLCNSDRSALASYLTFKLKELPFDDDFVHPFAEHSYRAIMDSPEIDEIILEQHWLDDDSVDGVLDKYCQDIHTRQFLKVALKRAMDEQTRWRLLKDLCDMEAYMKSPEIKKKFDPPNSKKSNFLRAFILDRLSPRLDSNVTTATNHLLKSPFCVHPKTGSIAVPFDFNKASEFRIDAVPRVDLVLAESNKRMSVDNETKENRKILGYKGTSLEPYVNVFDRFVRSLNTQN